MKRYTALIAAGALVALSWATPVTAEPSEACNLGEVPPSTAGGAGGVDYSGSAITVFSMRLCYRAIPPAPLEAVERVWPQDVDQARGSVYVKASASGALFVIAVDGDSTNSETARCTDGYVGVRGDASGVSLYGAPSGDFSDTSDQKSADAVAREFAEGCTG